MAPTPKSTPKFTNRPWRRLSRSGSHNGLGVGVATAAAGVRYEVVEVAGAGTLNVRIKMSGNGGTIDLIPLGPDFDPAQRTKNIVFASLVGTQYTTNTPSQVAIAAGVESLIQATCLGEGLFLVKVTGLVGAGAITYCDISQAGTVASAFVGAPLSGAGAPTSGAAGTGAGSALPGTLYLDTSMVPNVVYINVGSKASPSWMSLLSGNVV